jgi:hypothetical protein
MLDMARSSAASCGSTSARSTGRGDRWRRIDVVAPAAAAKGHQPADLDQAGLPSIRGDCRPHAADHLERAGERRQVHPSGG